jgi:hypothetical protein
MKFYRPTRHTIKFGAYAMNYNLRPLNPNGAPGLFSFTPGWTSSAAGLAGGMGAYNPRPASVQWPRCKREEIISEACPPVAGSEPPMW